MEDGNWTFTVSNYKNYEPSNEDSRSQVQNIVEKILHTTGSGHTEVHTKQCRTRMSMLIPRESEQAFGMQICWELLSGYITKGSGKNPSWRKSKLGKAPYMLAQFLSFPWHLFVVTTGKRILRQKNPPSEPIRPFLQSADKYSVRTCSV